MCTPTFIPLVHREAGIAHEDATSMIVIHMAKVQAPSSKFDWAMGTMVDDFVVHGERI